MGGAMLATNGHPSELRSNLPQQILGRPGFNGRISWLDGADSALMA